VLFRELQELPKVRKVGLYVIAQCQHSWWDVQGFLLPLGSLGEVHWVDGTTSKYIVAQFHQVFDVIRHVLSAMRIDVRDQTVLFEKVIRKHIPEPPKLISNYLGLSHVICSAKTLQFILELLNLFQKFVDVAAWL
jgi:hypothetical protein